MDDAHHRSTERLVELIRIEPIHEQDIQAETKSFHPVRHPEGLAMGAHIQMAPTEDREHGGHDDDAIKEPVGKVRGLEIGRDLVRVWIEERGEGLDGEQIDEHDEEQGQQHGGRHLPGCHGAQTGERQNGIITSSGLNWQALLVAFVSGNLGQLLSPAHLCFCLSAEYFKTTLGKVYRYTLPITAIIQAVVIAIFLLVK